MKLPSRNEIDKSKQLEKEVEIREGLKIAKRVDEVRMELVKEQNHLETFRRVTKAKVQAEIDDLLKRKSTLQYENEVLDRTNKTLKDPFDKEWERLNMERKAELDENVRVIARERVEIDEEKERVDRLLEKLESNNIVLENQIRETTVARNNAKDKETRARKLLEDAEINQAEAQSKIDAETNQLKKKEEELALTLRDIQVREAAIQKSVQALAKRERFINDKYATLQRSAKALNIPI